MKILRVICFAVLALLPFQAMAKPPVVVELYTSQGCNSCPPADAFLQSLAQRRDVIALSFHVTYWDYIGWRDTLGSKANDQRQRLYKRWLGTKRVYTPQMIVNGQLQGVGSDRPAINGLIDEAKRTSQPVIDIRLRQTDMGVQVTIPALPAYQGRATVQAIWFDPHNKVPVARGENAGKVLSYANSVRGTSTIGRYQGQAVQLLIPPMSEMRHCAVLVQDDKTGRIIGAAKLAL